MNQFLEVPITFFSSIGGAAGIAWLLIKYFGTKIIDAQLEKSLETYRFKVNLRFDRISKIHEKEFNVLPQIWDSIIEANGEYWSLTSPFQQYPDLNKMSSLELEEFFEERKIKTSSKKRIIDSKDKMNEYINILYWYKFNNIQKAYSIFIKNFIGNRIFLIDEIDGNLKKIQEIFSGMLAIINSANFNNSIDYLFLQKATDKHKELDPIIEELGTQIKKRLCFNEAD